MRKIGRFYLVIITGLFTSQHLLMTWNKDDNRSKIYFKHYASSTLEKMGITWGRIAEQSIEVSGFGGNASFSLVCISLTLL